MSSIIAIVPSAGMGKRFGGTKTLAKLSGAPVIAMTLKVLQEVSDIAEIIPVMLDEEMERGLRIVEEYGITKVKKIAPGGRERHESVYNGLKLVERDDSVVIIHDGVRPLVTPEIIKRSIHALQGCDGVVVGVPVKDTIKEVRDGIVQGTPARNHLIAVQTPQVFHYSTLMDAYTGAIGSSMHITDDSAIVENAGGMVKTVSGSYENIKITTPEDLEIAETLLRRRSA